MSPVGRGGDLHDTDGTTGRKVLKWYKGYRLKSTDTRYGLIP
jgi:hypothetical protein